MVSKNISITIDESLLKVIDEVANSLNIKRSPAITSLVAYLAMTPDNMKAIMPKGRDFEAYWREKAKEEQKPRVEVISSNEETNVTIT